MSLDRDLAAGRLARRANPRTEQRSDARRAQIALGLTAAVIAVLAASSAFAQVAPPPAPAPAAGGGPGDVLGALMLGGLMGLFGQGVRTMAGFRTGLDSAAAQGTQQDIFRAARVLVTLFIGFLAGIAATFVVGIDELIAVGRGGAGEDDVQLLLGIAAAGYAGTDFLEGFFGQFLKGVAPPSRGSPAAPADAKTNLQPSPQPGGAEPQDAGAAAPTPTPLSEVKEEVSELRKMIIAAPALNEDGSPRAVFRRKAPAVMRQLIDDFGFTEVQAAGILGNIGHECLGFTKLQEMRPVAGRGGYGWCQWTGPRRRAFEAWASERELDLASDEANYGFLAHELRTTERATVPAVKRETTLSGATLAFLNRFERAGVRHEGPRLEWAQLALEAFE